MEAMEAHESILHALAKLCKVRHTIQDLHTRRICDDAITELRDLARAIKCGAEQTSLDDAPGEL